MKTLTENEFIRLGGVKEIYEDDINDYYLIIRLKLLDIIWESDDLMYVDSFGDTVNIKYVHQAENLIKAINDLI